MTVITVTLSGMHCSSCAAVVERALTLLPGVAAAGVNFALGTARIEFDGGRLGERDLIAAIEKAGYNAYPFDPLNPDAASARQAGETRLLRNHFFLAAAASVIVGFFSMGAMVWPMVNRVDVSLNLFLQLAASTIVVWTGRGFFIRGIRVVALAGRATMDTLIALGVGSAYVYSLIISIRFRLRPGPVHSAHVYYEIAAFLITFILFGKYLESRTRYRASLAVRRLWDLRPQTALVIRGVVEKEIPVSDVIADDILIVKPGQRIPVDGMVIEGYAGVDESMLTGEPIPLEKSAGDNVAAGTINKNGILKIRALRIGKDTALARIIKLVQDAQSSKAPVQEAADKAAAIFVPAVLLIACGAFIFWLIAGHDMGFALNAFISVLIISCPCSLGLATPTAVMAGTGKAAEYGIIIKNAAALQAAGTVTTVIFDKTGTLTAGEAVITDSIVFNVTEERLLISAASLSRDSGHPLSSVFVTAARSRGYGFLPVAHFEAYPGEGITGEIEGAPALLGNRKLLHRKGIDVSSLQERAAYLENEGKTVMFCALNRQIAGIIAVRDTLKPGAAEAISLLERSGIATRMLTGDTAPAARAFAREAGIDSVIAEVLPEGKAEQVKKLQSAGHKVIFVGDGINDAPALAQADVGVALGAGTDVAAESADIILMKDDVRDVVTAVDISRYTMRKIRQNLFWAFLYNAVGIPVAAGALYPWTGFLLNPVVAGIAMSLSSVSVVANSLLMRTYRKKSDVQNANDRNK